jgi:Fur family transcriptional regulator, ferric uptake regulator
MTLRAQYVTRPREQIAAVLRSNPRFFSAAEIHSSLRDKKIALSTVYRTLEHLLERGEVAMRVDDAGESSYKLCEPSSHHHHAICRVCGRVEDVACEAIEEFARSLTSMHGFKLDGHTMEFYGTCRACR